MTLTPEEIKLLRNFLLTQYISYTNLELKELIRKIIQNADELDKQASPSTPGA